jgi:hypothetical protein
MAVALSWKGYVDTDLNFSEFFVTDHTLVLRFMPQFPNAYEGPFVAENGAGSFGIGQGDWLFGEWGTKLFLALGSQFAIYRAVLRAGTWYHLAVAARDTGAQRTFTAYLDGVQLGEPLTVMAGARGLPEGTLRLGKRTTGQTINRHDAQYYGFLDDVAVFKRAFSAADIQWLRDSVPHLTGEEPDLLVGYAFTQDVPRARLARPIVLHGAAQKIATSPDRNSAADAALLPLPSGHRTMHLPFPSGEPWLVVKGIDTDGEHHEGYASFCWDFVLADQPNESRGEYPHGTGGAPLYAAAGGRVVTARDSEPLGTATPNLLEIEQAPGEIAGYMHLRQGSIDLKVNATVQPSQQVALAGGTGIAGCMDCNHPHFGVADHTDGTPGFVTIPTAFSDYEVRTGPDSWQRVARGIPRAQQVLRNPPPVWVTFFTPGDHLRSLDVGQNADGRLEVFGVAPHDSIWHTWQTAPSDGWNGGWKQFYSSSDRLRELRVGRNQDGRLEVFGVAPSDSIWHTWQTAPSDGWNGSWEQFYSSDDRLRSLEVGQNADGRLEVFGVAPSDSIWHTWQIAPSDGWNVSVHGGGGNSRCKAARRATLHESGEVRRRVAGEVVIGSVG